MWHGYQIGYVGNALPPAADAYAGGAVVTDCFNMENYHAGAFLIHQGAIEDAGISNLVTLKACDDTTPTNSSTMIFRYRYYTETTDLWTAPATAAVTGFNFNAASPVSNGIHSVEFTAAEVFADGGNGYTYVQLAIAETANKTVTAGILFFGFLPRHVNQTPGGART